MNGLSPGETVQVAQFYDFNGNGVVDGPDLAVRSDSVTDGQPKLVGGATNVNVLRDEDGATNGAIRGSLRFAFAPEMARAVGSNLFRFSSPSNHFPVSNVPLTIVSAPYAQKVQGAVKNNGTNVPYAAVALVQVGAGPIGFKGIVGGTADAAGNYTLKAPPDSYWVIAFWPGFVMDFTAAPHVTLAPGVTITTNLNLIAATTTLAGTLVDNDNPALAALPYSQITVFDTSLHFTIAATDSNANFNLPVTPGTWTLRASWQSAAAHSYLVPQAGSFLEVHFDTSFGPVTDADVAFKLATALIYGTVRDNHSNAVPGITLSANGDGGAFDAFGMSDSNGLYSLAIDAGGGFVQVQDLTGQPANNYLWTGTSFGISDGQALKKDVLGVVPTAHFRGHILDDTGAPVSGLSIFASGANTTLVGSALATSDANGGFDLAVFGGTWQLYFNDQGTGLIFPAYPFNITDGVNVTNNIIARRTAGSISGYVHNQTNGAVSSLPVTCSVTVDSTSYNLTAYTDSSGNYSFPVFNGTWKVSLSPYDLLSRDYNPANPVNVTLPPTNGVANFILVRIGPSNGPPRIATTSLPGGFVGQSYYQTVVVTNAVRYLDWSITSGALPGGLSQDSFIGSISGTPTNTGLFNFTVQVTDVRGSNAASALSINVSSGPPQAPRLDLPTLLPGNVFRVRITGTLGQSYTLEGAKALTNWTGILTTNAPSAVFYLQEINATNASRFYRLKVNP
jgi:hypothetical protein